MKNAPKTVTEMQIAFHKLNDPDCKESYLEEVLGHLEDLKQTKTELYRTALTMSKNISQYR